MNWLGRCKAAKQPVKPDDHSEVVPLLPIPNRTVKRLCADDSADSRVKVGHCQANIYAKGPVSGPFVVSGDSISVVRRPGFVDFSHLAE